MFYLYYSGTCFRRFCDHHQGVIQENKQYTNNCTKCIITDTAPITNALRCTFCTINCTLFIFVYDTLKMVAEAAETCW